MKASMHWDLQCSCSLGPRRTTSGLPGCLRACATRVSRVRSGLGVGSTFNFAPGEVQIGGGTLRLIMEIAYDLRTFQILGGPGWPR